MIKRPLYAIIYINSKIESGDRFMNKLYNNNIEITSKFKDFFKEINIPLSEYRHELLINTIFGVINSESSIISDVTRNIKNINLNIDDESLQRKIRRFFDSKFFNPYDIYDSIITHVINNFKIKHKESLHISIDHSFCKDDFTTLMFTLRIGLQSIPIWFRCFSGTNDPEAFNSNLIVEGINYVYNLFKEKDCNIIFLADRWFPNVKVLEHINSLNCTYVFRTKKEHKIRYYDKREKNYIWKSLGDFEHKKYVSKTFENIDYTFSNPIKTNIILVRTNGTDDPWILVTNGNVNKAVKHYSYRFGAIEFHFKNTKSNGFNLEKTKIKNLSAFTGISLIVNIATLFLTILGADYCKNKGYYSKKSKIRDTKKTKSNNIIRVISLFNLRLTIFKKTYNSFINFKIKCNFILYDV